MCLAVEHDAALVLSSEILHCLKQHISTILNCSFWTNFEHAASEIISVGKYISMLNRAVFLVPTDPTVSGRSQEASEY